MSEYPLRSLFVPKTRQPASPAVMHQSPLHKLPQELRAQIAFWVARPGPGSDERPHKLSLDLSDFRLVCREFATLGEDVIASHARNVRRSPYRGVKIDFTFDSTRMLEEITNNVTLAAVITNVYIINARSASPVGDGATAETDLDTDDEPYTGRSRMSRWYRHRLMQESQRQEQQQQQQQEQEQQQQQQQQQRQRQRQRIEQQLTQLEQLPTHQVSRTSAGLEIAGVTELRPERDSTDPHPDTMDRLEQKQHYFRHHNDVQILVEMMRLLPNVKEVKWIEGCARNTDSSQSGQYQGPSSSMPVAWRFGIDYLDLFEPDRFSTRDSFQLLMRSWSQINLLVNSLRTLMANLTHLHITAPQGHDIWSTYSGNPDGFNRWSGYTGQTAEYEVWREVVTAAQAMQCLQIRCRTGNTGLIMTICEHVTWPQLRKFYFVGDRGGIAPVLLHGPARLDQFLLRHAGSLQKVRLPRLTGTSPTKFNSMEWWRTNFNADLEIITA